MDNVTNIGIIGAGKVGVSLGAYLTGKGVTVTGFYDKIEAQAESAAKLTGLRCYTVLQELLTANELVLITVPDDYIRQAWEECCLFPIEGKCFFHCSGALSSSVFEGYVSKGVHVGSMHPLCAVSSRESAGVFSGKFFVLEGDQTGLEMLKSLMTTMGNDYKVIPTEQKAKYHAAAVASSNLFCALADMAECWMRDCGFDAQSAHELLTPMMLGNMATVAEQGAVTALTGPVERGDAGTVAKHLAVLEGNDREIYRLLSLRLVEIAKMKHPDKDYINLLNVLMK